MCDPLEQFKKANWAEIIPRLAEYALWKVRRLHWNTPQGSLPEGKTVEDLVEGAIEKTLQGLTTEDTGKGIRKWNPEKVPDLLFFLKRVIDSDVNALVNLDEHQGFNYSAEISGGKATKLLEKQITQEGNPDETSPPETPEDELERAQERRLLQERYKRLITALYEECGDKEDEMIVLMAIEELLDADQELTPITISQKTGLTRDEVKNARKRIDRKAEKVKEKILAREEETANER